MAKNIWDEANYRTKIDFILDRNIREYDISKANISVLRDANILSEEEYQYLYQAPKLERATYVGKMQGRDSHVAEVLKEGIRHAREIFIKSNKIEPHEILFIRNDAITVLNKEARNLKITDRVSFRLDGAYTSFYSTKIDYNTLDFLYFYDRFSREEVLNIKGLGEKGAILHADYMMDFLKELFYTAQIQGVEAATKLLSAFLVRYTNRSLPVGFYREFMPGGDHAHKFRLIKQFSMVDSLFADDMLDSDKKFIDISYNHKLLLAFSRIFLTLQFAKR